MPDQWTPGTQYGYGSVVEYEGARCRYTHPILPLYTYGLRRGRV